MIDLYGVPDVRLLDKGHLGRTLEIANGLDSWNCTGDRPKEHREVDLVTMSVSVARRAW